jgi:Ni,Fe-hydrogenase III small subunit
MKTVKYVEVIDGLRFLEPMLLTWVSRLEQICRTVPQTPDMYYLEPTLVALLAGSAWSNGIQAVTEVKIKRSGRDGKANDGRLDLLLITGEKRVAVEAKIVWDWTLIPENVMDTLQTACAEVTSILGHIAERKMGIVFFVPWWNDNNQKEQLFDSVTHALSEVPVDVKVCCCNPDLDYPGAILLGKVADEV